MPKWLLSILKAIFPPRSHTMVVHEIERPTQTRDRHEQECAEYVRMMQRSRDRLTDDFDRMQ